MASALKKEIKEIKMRYTCTPWIQKRKEEENTDSNRFLFHLTDKLKGGRCEKKFRSLNHSDPPDFTTAYYMSSVPCPSNANPPCTNNSVSQFQQGALSPTATDASPNFNRTPDRGLNGTEYDFHVNASLSGYNINYLEPSNPGAYEIHYKSSNVSKGTGQIPSGSPSHCESRLPCSGPNCAVLISPQDITTFDPSHSTLKTQLSNLVNGGDHDYLYNLVLNVSVSNVSDVYSELIIQHPHTVFWLWYVATTFLPTQ